MEVGPEPDAGLPLAPPPPVPSGSAKPLPEAPAWHDRPHVPHGAIVGYALSHYRRPVGDSAEVVLCDCQWSRRSLIA